MLLGHRPPEQNAFGKDQHRQAQRTDGKPGHIIEVERETDGLRRQLAYLADHGHAQGVVIDEVAARERDKEHGHQRRQPGYQSFRQDQQHDNRAAHCQRRHIGVPDFLEPSDQSRGKAIFLKIEAEQLAPLAHDDYERGAIQVAYQHRRRQEACHHAEAQGRRREQDDAGKHRKPRTRNQCLRRITAGQRQNHHTAGQGHGTVRADVHMARTRKKEIRNGRRDCCVDTADRSGTSQLRVGQSRRNQHQADHEAG